ncbi:MAG: glycosyltransferase family 2 protein [Limnochordia bacterium]|nr:glycosyltransferase family 2 protein [Limnochordia bacterium]MDI9464902.1 glycosyltransferase family 2 protein [Bacillota bacterium]NLO95209.1 glycosyltransferase family 2 protein [Bacillota bacterium]HAN95901.1 glycosyl transferase family 2 [Bacillota bacterium]HOB39918.1 glycosyltransferase family 2 protein [Limnochordia bacterium]
MRVAAIVPAYNEEQTIGPVIEALLECRRLEEIIVVSDGSDDRTAEVARRYPVKVLELEQNVGKGGAMKAGANETNCEVLLFVDADLVGLHTEHIEALLEPVLSGRTAMSIGVFSEGRRSTDLAQKLAPALSGQRAVRKDLFDQVPNLEHSGYGVEIALTQYAERHNVEIVRVPLPTVSQVMKEEKRGLVEGMRARLKMYWEIVRSLRI